jgi:hypothetical protein
MRELTELAIRSRSPSLVLTGTSIVVPFQRDVLAKVAVHHGIVEIAEARLNLPIVHQPAVVHDQRRG